MQFTSPYCTKSLTKFNTKMQDFRIFSIGFQMLEIQYFQKAMNTCEMWSNGIKIAFFAKKLRKIAQRLGTSPIASGGRGLRPQTPVCVTFELRYTSLLTDVSQFRHFRILTVGLSLLPWTSS